MTEPHSLGGPSRRTVITHCRYCLSLCGLQVHVDESGTGIHDIEPDRDNPYTWRDFCRKGKTADQLRTHPQRITRPMRRVGNRYVEATYSEAIRDIAQRLNGIIDEHGPDAVGSYHGNPVGFNFADSTFFTGLLDAIGTGNRYWVSSVDQNALHLVQEAMYGSELIALPADVDEADCLLMIGMDPAVSKFSWIEIVPEGWSRALAAKARGADLIVVDPRRSVSAEAATMHIAIRPGEDWAFLLALLKVVFDEGLDRPATAVQLTGVEAVRWLCNQANIEVLAKRCDIPVERIQDVARRFALAKTAACITHTGVAHTEAGAIGEWLGNVLNAVTDRLDLPGGKRYERGYVDLPRVWSLMAPKSRHRSRLRDLPTIAGFHALAELTDEILVPGQDQIKGMIMLAGNPVVSGPDGAALDGALAKLDLLVAVDLVQRESHRHAHWLIPGTHWLEREGIHPVFGSMMDRPFAQYAQRAVPPPEGVVEEWRFFTDLALAMGRPLFGMRGTNFLVRASRKLASLARRPGWALNPRWVERALLAFGRRISLRDVLRRPHGYIYGAKSFGMLKSALRTPDKKVQCAPPRFVAHCRELLHRPLPRTDPDYPLLLVNRRNREAMNSWLHDLPDLFGERRTNALEMHPQDAAALGLHEGSRIRLMSPLAAVETTLTLVSGNKPGVVTMPHGWGSRVFDPTEGSAVAVFGSNRNLLVGSNRLDPLSQTPCFNGIPVRVEAISDARADDAVHNDSTARA